VASAWVEDLAVVGSVEVDLAAEAVAASAVVAPREDGRTMKHLLSEADHKRIEAAVSALEAKSSAELAVVVAHQSHDYGAYPFLWSAAIGLFAGGLLAVGWSDARAIDAILVEGIVFALSYLALHFTGLGIALIPKRLKSSHARRLAAAEFSTLVAQRTTGRSGLMLFVALAERHVEILVDRGIDEKIPKEQWRSIVERFGASTGSNTLTDRIVAAIDQCAAILAQRLPSSGAPQNEISNQVTER
jgi:putative membrane protein